MNSDLPLADSFEILVANLVMITYDTLFLPPLPIQPILGERRLWRLRAHFSSACSATTKTGRQTLISIFLYIYLVAVNKMAYLHYLLGYSIVVLSLVKYSKCLLLLFSVSRIKPVIYSFILQKYCCMPCFFLFRTKKTFRLIIAVVLTISLQLILLL